MAYEASVAALEGGDAPGTVIAVSQSPPFGLRKLSATLARTLGLDGATPLDVGGHSGALLDAFAIASALAADGEPPALVVATDHLVSYEDRVCDTLSAGAAAAFVVGASGGVARLGAQARAGPGGVRRVAPRHRAGGPLPAGGAVRRVRRHHHGRPSPAWSGRPSAAPATTPPSAPASPTPRPSAASGRRASPPSSWRARRSWGRSATSAPPPSASPSRWASTPPPPGDHLLALGYGGGEAIAQDVEVTGGDPQLGRRRPGGGRGDRPVNVLPLDPRPPGRTALGRRRCASAFSGSARPPTRSSTTSRCATWPSSPAAPRWPTPGWSPRTSRPSTSATSARSGSTTRTPPA